MADVLDVLLVLSLAIWVKLLAALVEEYLFGESSESLWWRGQSRSLSWKEAVVRAVWILIAVIAASSLLFFALCLKNSIASCINTYDKLIRFTLIVGLIEAIPPIFLKRIGDDK